MNSSGKAGKMDQKDSNALFAALYGDNNGKVDFLEFCTFLGVCGEELEVARTMTVARDNNEHQV